MTFGVAFGLSTLTAAGFGQIVSDVAGFTSGGIVDASVARLNLPHHNLTPQQMDLKVTRIYTTVGGCIGVVIGCLLGMSCLLWMDTDRADKAKKAKELQSIFESIMDEGHDLVNADRATLWMLEGDVLWSRVSTGQSGVIRVPASTGIVGAAVRENIEINVTDAYQDPRFNPQVDQGRFLCGTIQELPHSSDTRPVQPLAIIRRAAWPCRFVTTTASQWVPFK